MSCDGDEKSEEAEKDEMIGNDKLNWQIIERRLFSSPHPTVDSMLMKCKSSPCNFLSTFFFNYELSKAESGLEKSSSSMHNLIEHKKDGERVKRLSRIWIFHHAEQNFSSFPPWNFASLNSNNVMQTEFLFNLIPAALLRSETERTCMTYSTWNLRQPNGCNMLLILPATNPIGRGARDLIFFVCRSFGKNGNSLQFPKMKINKN